VLSTTVIFSVMHLERHLFMIYVTLIVG